MKIKIETDDCGDWMQITNMVTKEIIYCDHESNLKGWRLIEILQKLGHNVEYIDNAEFD